MSHAEVIDLTDLTDATDVTDRGAGSPAADILERREPWWAKARCRGASGRVSRLFFSERPSDIARAKRLCATCPVMAPCLEGALQRREPWGVWGGQLLVHGRILATKRGRGRPRKVPRPEDELPEIPIPAHLRELALVHS
jgi:WhiB family transcriptional regulator, redox-sensing transcriptional regulator